MLGDSSGGICLPRRPPRSFSQTYSQPISGSHNSRCSRLKCGWRRDMGKARISSSTRMSCACRTEEKSARSRVECPMVKMVATIGFYWINYTASMESYDRQRTTNKYENVFLSRDGSGADPSGPIWLLKKTQPTLRTSRDGNYQGGTFSEDTR